MARATCPMASASAWRRRACAAPSAWRVEAAEAIDDYDGRLRHDADGLGGERQRGGGQE